MGHWIYPVIYATLMAGVPHKPIDRSKVTMVVRDTVYGKVRGFQKATPFGDVQQFLGIPFATPPVGSLRFHPPSGPRTWPGIRDALTTSPVCMQKGMGFKTVGSEDCLYLNIYVPGSPSTTNNSTTTSTNDNNNTTTSTTNSTNSTNSTTTTALPVMVWLHGGGYTFGSGSLFDGSMLASRDVIVVTCNYRGGAFGFLSTEDDAMPGNYGILDQIHVLKWVRDNIAFFGGDPTSVTLFGESAGASSASILLLSPLTKGLFHRAIMQSGSSLCPWATTHPATATPPRLVAHLIASRVGCNRKNSSALLACLRKADQHALFDASEAVVAIIDSNNIVLKPRVETTFGVLPDLPIKLLASGKFHAVNTIQGFNDDENAFTLATPRLDSISLEGFRAAVLGTLSPMLFGALKSFAIPDKDELVDEAMAVYNVTRDSDQTYIRDQANQATSNLGFVGPALIQLDMMSNPPPPGGNRRDTDTDDDEDEGHHRSQPRGSATTARHYLYRFKHRPSYSTYPSWVNIAHGQDVPFVFGIEAYRGNRLSVSDADIAVSSRILTMWTNFAKTGNPNRPDTIPAGIHDDDDDDDNVDWIPFDTHTVPMLEIDTNISMSTFERREQIANLSLQLIRKIDTNLLDVYDDDVASAA